MTKAPTPEGTVDRGLGYQHRQQRRRLLEQTPDGTPCDECGQPMWPASDPRSLDADHVIPRAFGGTRATRLLHSTCNRGRGSRNKPLRTSQEW